MMEQPDLPPSYADYVALLTDCNLGPVLSDRTEDAVSFAFEHTQQRVRERYDARVLTHDMWSKWNNQIENQSPEVLYLTRTLRGSSYWCVWLEDTPILAVFRKRVVTVLPKCEWFVNAVNRAEADLASAQAEPVE
jgi:hypothetical protein